MVLAMPILVLVMLLGFSDWAVLSAASYPKDFVTGVDRVRLGMTEEQVSLVLGSQPIQRKETRRLVEARWDVSGPLPGQALGRFLGGPLISIEVVQKTLASPSLSSITPEVANRLTAYPIVRKAIDHSLTMTELHAIAAVLPQRHSWRMYGNEHTTATVSRWMWPIAPGARAVLVDETDGRAEQPFIRP